MILETEESDEGDFGEAEKVYICFEGYPRAYLLFFKGSVIFLVCLTIKSITRDSIS